MTGLTGSANFMKYSLFFFNFLFVITGIILLSIGLVVQGAFFGYEHFLESRFFALPALLIATGIIIFFVAFFGCYGAYKESYCMVLTFSCLLIIIFILELSAGIAGYALRDQTGDLLKNSLRGTMDRYGTEKTSEAGITALWDEVQRDITGIILLGIGLGVQGVFFGYERFLDAEFHAIPALLISTGIIIFIISILGCFGAKKENYCLIITFSGLLICIFILELSGGIAGYVLRSKTTSLLTTTLYKSLDKYGSENHTQITILWDEVQRDFDCCGIRSQNDWVEHQNGSTPISCCSIPLGQMDLFECNNTTKTLRTVGCVTTFGDFIREHTVTLGAAGISIAVVQFVGIFFACFMAKKIKQDNQISDY